MEKITDPVEIRDYNENGFVEFVAYKQPGYPGEWYGHFAFRDGESGQFVFTARKNSISFGDNTNTEHKYIYAETGAAQEPYIRYNVTGQYWEIYPTLGGGPGGPPGPILAEHTLLQSDIHTDTVTATPMQGDLIVANATPKWQRLAGNTTTTKKFLTQTGTGTQSALPAWDVIVDGDIPGTIVRTSRQILAGAGLSGGGDLSADRTLNWNGLTVRKNSGANIGTRRRLNFIEGGGISLSVSDDAVDDEVDITVTSTLSGGVTSLNGLTGALTLQGTQNQINVTSGGSTITLSLPQDIHVNAVPVFGGLTLARDVNNNITISFISGSTLVGEFLYAGINSPGSRYFGLIVRNADGFRIFTPNTSGSPVARIIVPNGDNVSVRITNGLVAGSGSVQIIGADGRIPALSSTYFASVDASALTNTLTVLKNSTPVGTRRQVNFIDSTGTKWTATDDGTSINLKAAVKRVIVLPIPGDPNAGAPVSVKVAAPTSGTITAIKHVCTVAASTTYTYDVNKNDATIYTNQSDRPTRTSAHGTDLVSAPMPGITTFSEGDVFSIDLDVKGTGVKDVVFFVFYTET